MTPDEKKKNTKGQVIALLMGLATGIFFTAAYFLNKK